MNMKSRLIFENRYFQDLNKLLASHLKKYKDLIRESNRIQDFLSTHTKSCT